ncbi:MAG: exodeoxyribonuclease VII large subunit, partial [Sulfurovaceae bacterium]|nr:exodeoxyribonuclease VII large subunit [Sulfurovaceae bacterium]
FMHILVEGEISTLTYHNSGHIYFTIKDNQSSIKCVMFRTNANRLKFRLERGQKIVVNGSVGVYTPRGEYQLYAVSIEPFGQGALALAYEQLKEKLQEKGYFDPSNKKPQPKYIKKLALVTASKSAGLQDMLKIINKRWRLVEVTVIDTLVQGDKSASQIAEALALADTLGVDAIVVGRGGGSREDLWAFNEEIVADAIFNLNTFVVSAVGHEIDVLISDFVADLRSPTPSSAIEMILPDQNEVLYTLDELTERYNHTIKHILSNKSSNIESLYSQFKQNSISNKLNMIEREFSNLSHEFKRVMDYKITQFELSLTRLPQQLSETINNRFQEKEQNLVSLEQNIKLNNPKLKQKSGWAEVILNNKKVSLSQIKENDIFTLMDIDTKLEVKCIQIL